MSIFWQAFWRGPLLATGKTRGGQHHGFILIHLLYGIPNWLLLFGYCMLGELKIHGALELGRQESGVMKGIDCFA